VTEVPIGPEVGSRTIAGMLPSAVGCWDFAGLSVSIKMVPAMTATKIVTQIIIVAVVTILTLVELVNFFKRFLIFIVQEPPKE
jgi:hypothetical protein